MSYHINILRTKNGNYDPIQLDELQKPSISNLGFKLDETQSIPTLTFPGNSTFIAGYADGMIWTENPDDETIFKMVELAQQLNARVRGDEYETYELSGKTYKHPDDDILKEREIAAGEAFLLRDIRRQKNIRNGIILLFIILGGIAYIFGKWLEN